MPSQKLFEQATVGLFDTRNRIVMAPMTRARTLQPGNIPTDIMAEYYAQRASAGLIISEATQISAQGQGYSWTPGIYSPEHIEGWKKVTSSVHEKEGRIFCQLWHVGRMSHPSFHPDGKPVAPSSVKFDAQVWIVDEHGTAGMQNCPIPRELTGSEISDIVNDYKIAALNAIEAGFDGVEVHGANGYLIDQFIRRTSNLRSDKYGGDITNRLRFVKEVLKTISDAIGADRTGIRVAPFITQRGMNDPQAIEAILELASWCESEGIAFIHLTEADWDDAPQVPYDFRVALRKAFSGAIIVAGNYDIDKADNILNNNLANLIAFGRPFVSNPDLPYRLQNDIPLSPISDPSTLFGGSEKGYTDYPTAN